MLTQGGARRAYDVLVLALGTRPAHSVQGAMAFRGLQDLVAVTAALDTVTSVAYIASSTSMWTAPLYEARRADRGVGHGPPEGARRARGHRRARRRVARRPGWRRPVSKSWPKRSWTGSPPATCELADGRRVEVGLAVALPHLTCPLVRGMPSRSRDGFTVVDETGQVAGVADIYAVGDMTGRRVPAAAAAGAIAAS